MCTHFVWSIYAYGATHRMRRRAYRYGSVVISNMLPHVTCAERARIRSAVRNGNHFQPPQLAPALPILEVVTELPVVAALPHPSRPRAVPRCPSDVIVTHDAISAIKVTVSKFDSHLREISNCASACVVFLELLMFASYT